MILKRPFLCSIHTIDKYDNLMYNYFRAVLIGLKKGEAKMKKSLLGCCIAILSILTYSYIDARRCSRSATAAGFIAGALTGAALAGAMDDMYYTDIPAYNIVYPGMPLYEYDYPTYSYAPVYAYYDTLYTLYPSYHLAY
jgi:hypothetical protein